MRSSWIFATCLLVAAPLGEIDPASAQPAARDEAPAAESELDVDPPRWQRRAQRLVSRGRLAPAMRIVRRQLSRTPDAPRPRHFICERVLPSATGDPLRREVSDLAAAWFQNETEPAERPRYARCQFSALLAVDPHAAFTLVQTEPLLGPPELRRLARAALLAHDDAFAEEVLVALIAASPRDSDALATLAALTMRRGQIARALSLYRRRVENDPASVPARRDVAGALLALGEEEDALRILRSLVTERPDNLDLRVDLLNALLELGRYAAVVSFGREASPRAPRNDARVHRALGLALLALHRDVEAREALTEAAERDPEDLRVRTALDGLVAPD